MSDTLSFEKIVNFRSLGGLKTQDNAEIVENKIYRSALLDFATETDMNQLMSIAPDVVVDFRMDGEKVAESMKLTLSDIDYQPMPINVGNFFSSDQMSALAKLQPADIDALFIKMYQQLPTSAQTQFKAVFNAILRNERVIYHCSAGKDRTGIMSYLILSVLGVSYDDIMANYLESNTYAKSLHQLFSTHRNKKLEGLEMTADLEAVFEKVQYVEPIYLDSLNDLFKAEYGGPNRYVEQVLGIDIDLFRKRLLR